MEEERKVDGLVGEGPIYILFKFFAIRKYFFKKIYFIIYFFLQGTINCCIIKNMGHKLVTPTPNNHLDELTE